MPIAKHRPNLAELIAKAAVQRKRQVARLRRHSIINGRRNSRQRESSITVARRASDLMRRVKLPFRRRRISAVNGDEEKEEAPPIALLLLLSALANSVLETMPSRILKLATIFLAFLTLSYDASNKMGPEVTSAVEKVDIFVDVYFIVDGLFKLVSLYAYLDTMRRMHTVIKSHMIIRKSGLIDVVIASLSLYFGPTEIGGWCRLLRVLIISSFSLEQLPHIDVLVSGITFGLRSIFSTWLLLALVFLVYAAIALTLFRENDPFHFGTIALSMWTFFEMSTLDNWSDVLYINVYGCNRYPSYYVEIDKNSTVDRYVSAYGTFYLPYCDKPAIFPVSATLIFVSFIFICGFILVSLTVAAVTAGINDRLDELQKEDLQEELGAKRILSQSSFTSFMGGQNNQKSLLTDPDMLLLLMQQVWKENEEHEKKLAKSGKTPKAHDSPPLRFHSEDRASRDSMDKNDPDPLMRRESSVMSLNMKMRQFFDIREQSVLMRTITGSDVYKWTNAAMVALSALIEIYTLQTPSAKGKAEIVQILFQIFFTFDIYAKILATFPDYSTFFKLQWNRFDFGLVLITWIPIFFKGDSKAAVFIGLFRVLRILRVLRMLNWIPELNIILQAIGSSARCLTYVILLMFVFFYHFAIAGIFLFRENDPAHFGSLLRAFHSLFQVATLDDWSNIARINMYGCDSYGYDSGEAYYDDLCEYPKPLGWAAAWYFICFVIVGVMVLVSLFVGIIITAMELLKEGIKEETLVWQKVREKQAEFNIRNSTIDNLLEIFDLIDVCSNGKLTLNELKPILELVSVSETNQFALFMQVDKDSSGQIDFAEFLELIHLIGKAYQYNIKKLRRRRASALKMGGKSPGKIASSESSSPDHLKSKHGFGSSFFMHHMTDEQFNKEALKELQATDNPAVTTHLDKKLSDVYENEGEENGDNESVYSEGSVKVLARGHSGIADDPSCQTSYGRIDSKDLEYSPVLSPSMLKQAEIELQSKSHSNVHGFSSDFSLVQQQRYDDSSPFTEELPPGSLRSEASLSPVKLRTKSSLYEQRDEDVDNSEEKPKSR